MLLLDKDNCQGLGALVAVVHKIVNILWMLIPIALILFGIIDLGKAVISSDDKEIAGAKSKLLKRVLYAVAVFLIVWLVNLVLGILADSNISLVGDTSSWLRCWKSTNP